MVFPRLQAPCVLHSLLHSLLESRVTPPGFPASTSILSQLSPTPFCFQKYLLFNYFSILNIFFVCIGSLSWCVYFVTIITSDFSHNVCKQKYNRSSVCRSYTRRVPCRNSIFNNIRKATHHRNEMKEKI